MDGPPIAVGDTIRAQVKKLPGAMSLSAASMPPFAILLPALGFRVQGCSATNIRYQCICFDLDEVAQRCSRSAQTLRFRSAVEFSWS
eukprot:4073536-Heterocapsa_arctica.AAC.1